jgi:hypothetical protein
VEAAGQGFYQGKRIERETHIDAEECSGGKPPVLGIGAVIMKAGMLKATAKVGTIGFAGFASPTGKVREHNDLIPRPPKLSVFRHPDHDSTRLMAEDQTAFLKNGASFFPRQDTPVRCANPRTEYPHEYARFRKAGIAVKNRKRLGTDGRDKTCCRHGDTPN